MQIRLEKQLNAVADEVSALTAVARPILLGILYALKRDVVAELGGASEVKLKMLPRLYRAGDGDCGICFEYAVHDALQRREPAVLDRVNDALSGYCKLRGDHLASILFGAEKAGSQQLIDTSRSLLTNDSALLSGTRGRPVKLKRHIDGIASAFRRATARAALPSSISGLWKADLFLGMSDADKWVGTSVKLNASDLESARGLRVGIVPSREGSSDAVRRDESRNLIVCPLPYDRSFVETFYEAWGIVKQFIAADAQLPSDAALPRSAQRQVARSLVSRREFPVLEVVSVLGPLAQPELLETTERQAKLVLTREGHVGTGAVVAPGPRICQ